MDSEEMCEAILEWAEDNDWFDTSFVDAMQNELDSGYDLTDAQIESLQNIIDKFEI